MFKKSYLIPLNNSTNYIIFYSPKTKQNLLICKFHNNYLFYLLPTTAYLDPESNYILLTIKYKDLKSICQFNKLINTHKNFIKTTMAFYIKKIRYKGKGFRIKNIRRKKIKRFVFGKAHIQLFFIRSILWKRFSKTKYLLLHNDKNTLKRAATTLKMFKKYNQYTWRGIREIRQILYKRKGRKSVSTYI